MSKIIWGNRSATFFLLASLIFSLLFLPVFPVKPSAVGDGKLDLIMSFHMGQAAVIQSDYAMDVGYVDLLRVLRAHPSLHFAFTFTGTMIEDFLWWNSTAIDLIRDGLSEGQFELLGVTYSNNVMYSCNTTDNMKQIQKHREILWENFRVEPKGFLPTERCWKQSFVELLAQNGYEYAFVEDHILYDSGITTPEWKVRYTTYNSYNLTIFDDDTSSDGVTSVIDSVAFGANPQVAIDWLQNRKTQDVNDDFAVCYVEDAWLEWLYGSPNSRLDALLTLFEENSDWLVLTTPEEYLMHHNVTEEITPIVDGQARWMENYCRNHGWKDWFDFNANSTLLNTERRMMTVLRNKFLEIEHKINIAESQGKNVTAATRLLEHAWTVYAAYQFEFGCATTEDQLYYNMGTWGIGGQRFNISMVSAKTAEYALNTSATPQIVHEDINLDGLEEIILQNNVTRMIFTPYGGRLLYWFDVKNGICLLSNDLATYYGEPISQKDSFFQGNIEDARTGKTHGLRRKALNDYISIEGADIGPWPGPLVNATYSLNESANSSNASLEFSYEYAIDEDRKILIRKNVTLPSMELYAYISYHLENTGSSEINRLQLRVENSFSPDEEEILKHGKAALKFKVDGLNSTLVDGTVFPERKVGLTNVLTGTHAYCEFSPGMVEKALKHVLTFCGSVELIFPETSLEVGETMNYSFKLCGARSMMHANLTFLTLHKLNLHANGNLVYGNKLTVKFYSYSGPYQGETTVWNRTTPTQIELSENVSHPLDLPIEIASLVLTHKNGTIISIVTAFTTRRYHLMARLVKLDSAWLYVSPTERSTIFSEIIAIDGQWPYAPS